MHRIDTPNAVAELPSPSSGGTPGFFDAGDPSTGRKATYFSADWANAVQEELISVIEGAGLTPNKGDLTQLLQALQAMSVQQVPSGSIFQFAGAAAPGGYLICNGSAVSRSTYAALFTAIGTTWGAGNGSTTFNLPDLRGRSPIGAGTGAGLTARALAATGGEEGHQLAANEVPALSVTGTAEAAGGHNHAITDPGHEHDVKYSDNNSGDAGVPGHGGNNNHTTTSQPAGTGISLAAAANHSHTVDGTANAGGGGIHNNMQPYAVVNFIIKT
jgi:microcystin-dependent protein